MPTLYLCPNPDCSWREVLGRGTTPWPGGTCECGTGGVPVSGVTGAAPEPFAPTVAPAKKAARTRKSR